MGEYALMKMDEWLTNLGKDESADPAMKRILRAKPADLVDSCYTETDDRIVFYFSLGSVGAGALTLLWTGMQPHTWAGIAELLAVGVLATVAQWMITRAYSTGRTLVNASLHYLGIAFSFAYGVLLFDDRVTPLALLGMVLIVGAGLFATVLRTRSVAHDQGTAPNES